MYCNYKYNNKCQKLEIQPISQESSLPHYIHYPATQSLLPSPLKLQLYHIPPNTPPKHIISSKYRPVIYFYYIISVKWVIILLSPFYISLYFNLFKNVLYTINVYVKSLRDLLLIIFTQVKMIIKKISQIHNMTVVRAEGVIFQSLDNKLSYTKIQISLTFVPLRCLYYLTFVSLMFVSLMFVSLMFVSLMFVTMIFCYSDVRCQIQSCLNLLGFKLRMLSWRNIKGGSNTISNRKFSFFTLFIFR